MINRLLFWRKTPIGDPLPRDTRVCCAVEELQYALEVLEMAPAADLSTRERLAHRLNIWQCGFVLGHSRMASGVPGLADEWPPADDTVAPEPVDGSLTYAESLQAAAAGAANAKRLLDQGEWSDDLLARYWRKRVGQLVDTLDDRAADHAPAPDPEPEPAPEPDGIPTVEVTGEQPWDAPAHEHDIELQEVGDGE